MKVLHVYKDYYPVLGGIEGHIRVLTEGLRARSVDVNVLVTNTASRTVHEVIDGVPVTKAGRIGSVSSAPISLALFDCMQRFQPDVAHLHFPYPIGELAYLRSGRARRLVLSYHSDIVRQRLLGLAYRPFLREILRRADAIALSNPTFLQNSQFVSPHADKCVLIHYGQDLARFTPTPRLQARAAELRSTLGDQIVLFVGRLRYYKGGEVLIEAMRSVAAPTTLVIIGDGPMESQWRALARSLAMEDRVHFAGPVPDDELPAYFHAARVFVLPSTHKSETFGIVQIEAMASGLPCVCTELGTGTSYVNRHGETGLVVPPRDPRALADALGLLLSDPAMRESMGAAARLRANAEFSRDVMVDKTLSLYERLLAT